MLILTRKKGEKIIIGNNDDFNVTVVSINRGNVSLGITAPKYISVHR